MDLLWLQIRIVLSQWRVYNGLICIKPRQATSHKPRSMHLDSLHTMDLHPELLPKGE